MERALYGQGIRTRLKEGKKRHEFQVDHGYRKFFKTRCELGGMKPINIEKLLSHSTGISIISRINLTVFYFILSRIFAKDLLVVLITLVLRIALISIFNTIHPIG
jgi:hypothetical protein